MYYILETKKPFKQAVTDLEIAVVQNGFGVLHIHDLAATLRAKGVPFTEECRVFEVCNPKQASRVLASDMRLNMALPCRLSVFTDKGVTKLGMISPMAMLSTLSEDPELRAVAQEVEDKTRLMIEQAR